MIAAPLTLLIFGQLWAQEELADPIAWTSQVFEVPPESPLTELDREHWSFQPITRPRLPRVDDAEWCRNPIDRFIRAGLERKNLQPLPVADRETLLRRICYDLTGLPPSPELRKAFLSDQTPGAWERIVEQLFSSPAFGEHWGQHWLDLVRFAETDGFEHDLVRPNAWRYRDWVIHALNVDMPYDEFLRQQLAGDELYPDDPAALVATGFLLCGPDMPDINLQEERRHVFLNDMTGTVGGALLGLTFECAACHDHKFDPISQHDFYRLRAYFETMEPFKEQPLPSTDQLETIQKFEQERADRWLAIESEIKQQLASGVSTAALRIEDLKAELARLKKASPPNPPMARAVHARPSSELSPARLWVRGDFRRPGPTVRPEPLRVASVAPSVPSPRTRAQLADWLTNPSNPLTARVIVNRLWQHHFGTGLSETPSDFGIMGGYVEQKELLDWLASELIRQDWDLKSIQRLIVTSTVYQLASAPDADSQDDWDKLRADDPDNRLWGRRERRRLSGEMVRDSLLAMTGDLNDTQQGPGVRPPLPKEVVTTLLKNQWPVSENRADHHRRSIYLFVRRNLTFPLFQVLDKPDANRSCACRNETTIAPQALQLMNSEFIQDRASALALRLSRSVPHDTARFVDAAFSTTVGRNPHGLEYQAAVQFLSPDTPEARADLCRTLFNTNAFLYVD